MMARELLEGNALVARRLGRIAFGAVLLAGTAYLVAAACSARWASPIHAAQIIGITWLAAAVAGVATSRIAARARRVWHPERLFAESVMVPVIGITLLGPITLHMLVALPISGRRMFDTWVAYSIVVTCVAHIVFVAGSALRAYELVAGRPARSPRSIYIATVTASCVPFILLFAIPPVLVAITALPFIPLLRALEPLVARERRQSAEALHPLPRATLHVRGAV